MVFKTSLDKLTGFRDVSHAKEKGRNPSLGSDGCGVFNSGVNDICSVGPKKVGHNCRK